MDSYSIIFHSLSKVSLINNLSLIFMRNREKTLGEELYHFSYWGEKRIRWLLFLSMESLINLFEDHELLLASFEFNNPIHVLFHFFCLLMLSTIFEDPLWWLSYYSCLHCTSCRTMEFHFTSCHFYSHRLAHLFVSLIFLTF